VANAHGLRNRPRRRPVLFTSKLLVALIAGLVFLVTAAGWSTTHWLDHQLRDVAALDPDSDAITDAEAQRGDENILLVGSDTRIGAQSSDNVGDTEQVRGARSDTVMIAHLPANRSRAVIVSFPRDLQIHRPPCTVWDPASGTYTAATDPGATVAKLNSAYEIGGPLCLTRVMQHLSGLAVTRFVGVDFQGFKGMVDAVGGVPVCVQRPLQDTALGTIIAQPGYSTISGSTALNFVRARNIVGDPTADYGRITRQQRFLSALLREMLSARVLFNPVRLRAVAEAITSNTVGENIGTSALLNLSQSVQGLDPAEVTFVTVPTTGESNEHGNEELRVRDTAALFRAIIDGVVLPGEAPTGDQPADTTAADTTAPDNSAAPAAQAPEVRVRVLNGTKIDGLAAQVSQALQDAGFSVLEVGNSEDPVDATTIRYPPDQEAAALTLLAALPEAVLQPDQSLAGTVLLEIGPDLSDVEAADLGAAPPAPPQIDELGPLATVNGADTTCS